MSYPPNPQFHLTVSEKVMLRAFIQGTQVAEAGNPDSLWTHEALTALQQVLDGSTEKLESAIVQDLFCIFAELILQKDKLAGDIQFTKIMVKFLHYLVHFIDWTTKKRAKNKPGPRPEPRVSIPIVASEEDQEQPESQEPTDLA